MFQTVLLSCQPWKCCRQCVWCFLLRCMECRRGLAMRILSDSLSVRLSVSLSNAWFVTKWKKRSVQIFIPYERLFSLFFWEEDGWWCDHSTWNFGSTGPNRSQIADFQPIFAPSASAVTLSKKSSINTTSTRFPVSSRWSSYVAPKPPKGGGFYPCKIQGSGRWNA